MRIDQELAALRVERDSMLTVGVFDGVHRGHRLLIAQLVEQARRTGRAAGVVTFRNHPAAVLRADFQPQYLTTPRAAPRTAAGDGRRFRRARHVRRGTVPARRQGVRRPAGVHSAHERTGRRRRLRDGPRARRRPRGGLTRLGEELGFTVRAVDLLADGPLTVKSTSIRRALAEGDVESVAIMLGRNFSSQGVVAEGDKRGRELGFPTANLETTPGLAVPANGIYAAWAEVDGERHMAAVSIGVRPTFGEHPRAIEAYLLEYQGNLYGKTMRLEFVAHLRDELKFDTVEALVAQMRDDVQTTSQILRSLSEVTN